MTKSLESVGVSSPTNPVSNNGGQDEIEKCKNPNIINNNPVSSWSSKIPPLFIAIVAVAVLVGFGFAYACMFDQAKSNPQYWDKLVYLYNSIQTIVIAAASALFGVQISSGQARAAEQQAITERSKAAKIEDKVKTLQKDMAMDTTNSEKSALEQRRNFMRQIMTLLD